MLIYDVELFVPFRAPVLDRCLSGGLLVSMLKQRNYLLYPIPTILGPMLIYQAFEAARILGGWGTSLSSL